MEPERTTSDGRIDLEPDKPVWLVELSIARDTRRFVEGVVQKG